MVSILGLFAKSPFGPIQEHMHKVHECVVALKNLLNEYIEQGPSCLPVLVEKVSLLEHEADVIKNDIRDNLPRSIFMPVDRRDLLDVVHSIDAIADAAEDVARLLVIREMPFPDELKKTFNTFVSSVFGSADLAEEIVSKLDNLLAVSFTGREADTVLSMINALGKKEHEADVAQEALLKELFKMEESLKTLDLMWWLKTFGKLGDIANLAEKMVNRLRLFMSK